MHRIDHPTAAVSMPSPGAAGTPGYFSEGDPAGGVPATVVTQAWANAVQEEIVSVIAAAGIDLDKSSNAQLLAAIQAIAAGAVPSIPPASESVSGIIKIATVALAQAMTNDATALTPKKLADAFRGANQSLSTTGGFQKMPGGYIIQSGTFGPVAANATASITFPLAFPTACTFAIATRAEDGGADPDSFSVNSRTKTGMVLRYQDSGTDGSTANMWLAVGY